MNENKIRRNTRSNKRNNKKPVSKETIIIDTNVLLRNPHILNKVRKLNILMPVAVIKEVDTFKKGFNSRSYNAREVSRILEKELQKDKNSRKISFISQKEYDKDLPVDDIIIEVAKRYNATIISDDTNLRAAADCEGVKAIKSDIKEKDYKSTAYKGYSKIKKVPKEPKKMRYASTPNHHFIYKDSDNKTKIYNLKDGCLHTVKNTCYSKIEGISARNTDQKMAMNLLMDPKISLVSIQGSAGTGKTLLALACGIHQSKKGGYSSVSVSRNVVPMGRDIGFLPGDPEEKVKPFLSSIFDNLDVLAHYNNDHNNTAYTQEMMATKRIDIQVLAFMRGRSISNKFIIIDEAQNLTQHEIKTIITRCGEGSKIVLLGDPNQIDVEELDRHNNGLTYITNKFVGQECFGTVTLSRIERSTLAKLAVKILG